MIVWKVTSLWDASISVNGMAGVQYGIGITSKAPKWLAKSGYHLFAFRRLRDARDFACSAIDRIYKAEAKRTTKKLPLFLDTFDLRWGKANRTQYGFPIGTIMCEEITLLKRVW